MERVVSHCYAWQPPGRLAQLGERRLDKAEVTGSSPVSPIERSAFAGLLSLRSETSPFRSSFGGAQMARYGLAESRRSRGMSHTTRCSRGPRISAVICWLIAALA